MANHVRKRGDTNRALQVTLTPSSLDLTGATCLFLIRRAGSTAAPASYTPDVSGLTLTYQPVGTEAFVMTAGTYYWEVQITFSNGRIQTIPESGFITIETRQDLS